MQLSNLQVTHSAAEERANPIFKGGKGMVRPLWHRSYNKTMFIRGDVRLTEAGIIQVNASESEFVKNR